MFKINYIAYIDEAGDAGLKNVRARSTRGASEWLVMSAVLVRAEREADVNGWVTQMLASLDQPQVLQLHFRDIPLHKRQSIVRQLATLKVRLFVLLSHKRNMEGYRNLSAEQAGVNETAWFHVWCTKLLMESVTNYCGRRSRHEYGEPRIVRCEFSATGGLKLGRVVN